MRNRSSTRFKSGPNREQCQAWFYKPDGEGPFPVILMGHGLGGIKEMRLDAYAERFVDAGYACLVFDYRHFGESDGNPRQLLDINQQLEDWRSAITFIRQQKDINPDQIILWGTSFGGGHVITTASMTPSPDISRERLK